MAQVIRTFLLAEAATFVVAALIHSGWLMSGYEHHEARVAESIIAAVLLAGAALAWLRPMWTRAAGLVAQGFALFLTLVGIVTIAVGIGPRTPLDIVYHVVIVAVLVWGLIVARRVGVTVP
jgi:hypothetical protein